MQWSEAQDDQLIKLNNDGLSAAQIGIRLGVTRNAVMGRAHRLGLEWGKMSERQMKAVMDQRAKVRAERHKKDLTRKKVDPKVTFERRSQASRIQFKDTKPEPKPLPKPVKIDLKPVPIDQRIGCVSELKSGQCKWPIGHFGEADFHFCDQKKKPNKPYCEAHCAVAYTPNVKRTGQPMQAGFRK